MRAKIVTALLLPMVFCGCMHTAVQAAQLKSITKEKPLEQGIEYRVDLTGICGRITDGGILVTRVAEGSPADGVIKVGDVIQAARHRDLAAAWKKGNFEQQLGKALYRASHYFWRHLPLKVKREGEGGAPPSILKLRIRLDHAPGECHYWGPIGVFAQLYPEYLVVDSIEEGAPAESVLKKGDRITAVGGERLRGSQQTLFAEAIDKAESREGAGKLALTVVRPVDTNSAGAKGSLPAPMTVNLKIPVMGSYSPTAPYDCAKTDKLIRQAADAIVEHKAYGRLGIGLLGLLATGEKPYIEHVGKVLKGSKKGRPNMYASKAAWGSSYRLLTTCEYYLLTRDKSMLPEIREYAVAIAEAQDAAGLWNHRGANPDANFGKLHGRLYGYGAINQTSVALWIGLILSEKCGVKHEEVRNAIERTTARYSNWIGKGCLPYGNHQAMEHTLNNNGTSGSVAVGFRLAGNKEGARYYGMLSTASHEELLAGHAGPFFSTLWSGPGVNVVGPHAATAYAKNTRWFRTLSRTGTGLYVFEGPTGARAGEYLGNTGSALLNLCLGRRAIYITGKEADKSIWMSPDRASAIARMGSENIFALDPPELIKRLSSPLPKVRYEASEALALNADDAEVWPALRALLAGDSRDARIGACTAIQALKLDEAVDHLLAILTDRKEDLWLREKAVMALMAIGEPARKCVPAMLEVIAQDEPQDPFDDLDRRLGMAMESLAPDPYELEIDKKVFYRAVRKLLDHEHMWARTAGMRMLNNIPLEDLPLIVDKMLYVIEDKDRDYTSYHKKRPVEAGLKILQEFGVDDVTGKTADDVLEIIQAPPSATREQE